MENSSISLYKMIKNTLGEKTEKHHVNPLMWKPWGKSYITARCLNHIAKYKMHIIQSGIVIHVMQSRVFAHMQSTK